MVAEGHQYEIRLKPDLANRTLTISDTGIGMSRQELIANIGTIRNREPANCGSRPSFELLYELALIAEGSEMADPVRFQQATLQLLEKAF